jgi:glycosyltransferase involved in cell wall biosynthesis
VDSGSSDDSCARAEAAGAHVISVRPGRPCAAIGRNAGYLQAQHEFVQFLDGDTLLHPDWLRRGVAALADPRIACVFGRREEIAPRQTIYNFWTHHDWYTAPGPAHTCAGDAMFRRSVLEAMDGFDASLIAGEEPDLCFRIARDLGAGILSLDQPMTRHDINMTRFRSYWRRCFRTGHAYAEVSGRHPHYARWRRTLRRNVVYAVLPPAALAASLVLASWWPLALWTLGVFCLLARTAVRLRPRVGSMSDAARYAAHLYLSKLPMALGQCDYWLRRWRRRPRALIEYRNEPLRTAN